MPVYFIFGPVNKEGAGGLFERGLWRGLIREGLLEGLIREGAY